MIYCSFCGAANATNVQQCFACKQTLEEDSSDSSVAVTAVPLLHERYRLLAQVGTGGFGEVHRAMDTVANRVVAIKRINLKGLRPQEVIDATETFNREVELLSQLSHPNLPHIYEHFTDPEHWYLIMEFLEGETLEHYLLEQGGTLPTGEVLDIAVQLCSVLDYLHNRQPPIIFRDVKPTNVMLTPGKQVYLIDFGAARLFKAGKPHDTIAFGSPGYAPPEQYGKAQTTPRSDLYSLGATLHYLLSGDDPSDSPFHFASLEQPPDAQNKHSQQHKHGNQSHQKKRHRVPRKLQSLITRMIEMDANNRPQSAAEVQNALKELMLERQQSLQATYPVYLPGSNQPFTLATPAPPPTDWASHAPTVQQAQLQLGLPQTSAKSPQKHVISRRTVVSSLAVLTIAGGIWGGDILINGTGAHSEPVIVGSAPPTQQYPIGLYQPYTCTYLTDVILSVNWSAALKGRVMRPEGMIAATSRDQNVLVLDGDTGKQQAEGFASVMRSSAWSPDGTSLALGGQDGMALLMSSDLKKTVAYTTISGSVQTIRWSHDGATLALAGSDHNLYLWNPTNGTLMHYQSDKSPINAISWSHDDKLIASGHEDGKILVWNTQTGKIVYTYQGNTDPIYAVAFSPVQNLIASGGCDLVIQLWDATTGAIYGTYDQHNGWIRAIEWSPNGAYIASAGDDRTAQVWDPTTLNQLFSYNGHSSTVTSVAWSPGMRRIASGSYDKTIHIWAWHTS